MEGRCLSNQGGDVGFGEKTPLPARNGEGCRPCAAVGQVLDSIWDAQTQPVLALEVGEGCDLWKHCLLETN